MAPVPNPWSPEHWDPVEQANYIRKYGMARAVARAHDAGTTVHGAPPIPKYDHQKHVKAVRQIVIRRNRLRGSQVPVLPISDVVINLGFNQEPREDLIDQEIDIVLSPGDITFGARFKLGYSSAPNIPFGNERDIFPGVVNLGISEAAAAVATIDVGSVQLGVDESTTFDNTQFLSSNMSLGFKERAVLGDERQIEVTMDLGIDNIYAVFGDQRQLHASMALGFNDQTIMGDVRAVVASMDLGLAETATVIRENYVTTNIALGFDEAAHVDAAIAAINFSVGVSETAATQLERDLTVHASLGFNETAVGEFTLSFPAAFDLGVDMVPDVVIPEMFLTLEWNLGIDEAADVIREAYLTVNPALGVDEAAIVSPAIGDINIDLGITEATVADIFASLTASPALGVDETASIDFEKDLVASMGLGITEHFPVYGLDLERNTINDIHIGFNMDPLLQLEFPIGPYSADLGISMASVVTPEIHPVANIAVGADVAAEVDALVQKLYGSFIVANASTSDVVSFSANVGQEADSRYIIAVVEYQAGGGVSNMTGMNLGAVNNATFIKRASYGGIAQVEIWYAHVPTGKTITCEYLLSAPMVSSCAIYSVYSGTDSVNLLSTGSDSKASTTASAVTALMDTEKDTGFVIAGTINSSSTPTTTGPAQLTNDAAAGERRFWSGVDTNNSDTFQIDTTALQSKIIAAASFGAFNRKDLVAANDLGITESVILSRVEQDLTVPNDLGITMASRLDAAFGASAALGITQASTLTISKNLAAAPALGASMAAAVQVSKNLTAAPALGITQAATVTTVSATAMTLTFLGSETNNSSTDPQTFTNVPGSGGTGYALGAANANLWVVIAVYYGTAGIHVPSSVKFGTLSATRACRTTAVSARAVDIWYVNVPLGGTANIVVANGGNGGNDAIGVWKMVGALDTANITTSIGGGTSPFNPSLAVSKATSAGIAVACTSSANVVTYTEPSGSDFQTNETLATTYRFTGGHHDGLPISTWSPNLSVSAGASLTNFAAVLFPPL